MDDPLVTIVTPSWNSEKYIEATILGVIGQTYKNIEYIIVDGGSVDNTLGIIRKYEKHISHWVSEPDKGMYDAINKGMSMAKGDIVAYINSDDLYYPDTISKIVRLFENDRCVDLVYGNLNFIDEVGKTLYVQKYPSFNLKLFINSNYSMIGQPAAFWRKSLMDKVGLFDESLRMASDFEFFIRAGQVGTLRHVPEVLAAFRLHPNSMTWRQMQLSNEEIAGMRAKYRIDSKGGGNIFLRRLADVHFKLINWRVMLTKIGMLLKNGHA